MVKIVGGDNLTKEQRLTLVERATGADRRRARRMLAREGGVFRGDVTLNGVTRPGTVRINRVELPETVTVLLYSTSPLSVPELRWVSSLDIHEYDLAAS